MIAIYCAKMKVAVVICYGQCTQNCIVCGDSHSNDKKVQVKASEYSFEGRRSLFLIQGTLSALTKKSFVLTFSFIQKE